MQTRIERVTEQDKDLWIDWRMRVLAVVFDGDPAAHSVDLIRLRDASAEYFANNITDGTLVACFAKDETDTIVGCGATCTLQELPSPDNPTGLVSYLMNIFVVPEARGGGVGEQIVTWLLDESCERGITRVFLESTADGRPLYEKLGFVDSVGYMILDRRACEEDETEQNAPQKP